LKDSVQLYWEAFLARQAPGSPLRYKQPVAEKFGDSPAMADDLGMRIKKGVKTATCSALWEMEYYGTPFPYVGLITIVLDSHDQPMCIIETLEVDITPFYDVSTQFAYDEGEGDRSLAFWRESHWRYFTRSLAKINRQVTADMPLVCERFRVIYK